MVRCAPEAHAVAAWPLWSVREAVLVGLAELVARGHLAVARERRRRRLPRRGEQTVARLAAPLPEDAPWALRSLADALGACPRVELADGSAAAPIDALHRGLRRAGHGWPKDWGSRLRRDLEAQGLASPGGGRRPPLTPAGREEQARLGRWYEDAQARWRDGEPVATDDPACLFALGAAHFRSRMLGVAAGSDDLTCERLLAVDGVDVAAAARAWPLLEEAVRLYWGDFGMGPDGGRMSAGDG